MTRQKVYDNPPKISDAPNVQLERAYLWHVTWNGFMDNKMLARSQVAQYYD
jgi:hypothetical protein